MASTLIRPDPSNTRPTGRLGWVFALLIALLLVVAMSTYVGLGGELPKSNEVSAAMTRASHAVGSSVASGVSSVRARAGLARRDGGTSVPLATVQGRPTAKVPRKKQTVAALRRPEVITPSFDIDPGPADTAAMTTAMERARAFLATLESPPPSNESLARTEPAELAALTVYSSASSGVEPPAVLSSQFPDQHQETETGQVGRIEFVVLPDGTVDSVRLLDPPRNVHEAMFLSAVKAWKFRPAVKDNQPVAYRQTITISFR